MLASSKQTGTVETWEQIFVYNPDPGDDGWFVDDFRVKDALTSPATLVADIKPNSGLATCGSICDTVTPSLVADPPGALAAPGQVVELSAAGSVANRCVSGALQYRFWIDENANQGAFEPGTDSLLRNWSESAVLLAAPSATTHYATDIRCSTLATCDATVHLTVAVSCPGGGGEFPTVSAEPTKGTYSWSPALDFVYAEGGLAALDATYSALVSGSGNGPTHLASAGGSIWLLFRTDTPGGGEFCNSGGPGAWSGGGSGEAADRDGGSSTLP